MEISSEPAAIDIDSEALTLLARREGAAGENAREASLFPVSRREDGNLRPVVCEEMSAAQKEASVVTAFPAVLPASTAPSRSSLALLTCSECGMACKSAKSLKTHSRRHTGEKPFACTAVGCQKAFRTQGERSRHVKSHTGIKNYVCQEPECTSAFTTSANLRVHQTVKHKAEKRYKCDVCDKAFGYLTNFKNHTRIHTGEKQFSCGFVGCSKRFTEYSTALRHALRFHSVHGSLRCPKCDRVYRSMDGLNYHMLAIHSKSDSRSGPSPRLLDTGYLRNLVLSELPDFMNLVHMEDDSPWNWENEREAAVLLGFHDEHRSELEQHDAGDSESSNRNSDPFRSDWHAEDAPRYHDNSYLEGFPELLLPETDLEPL